MSKHERNLIAVTRKKIAHTLKKRYDRSFVIGVSHAGSKTLVLIAAFDRDVQSAMLESAFPRKVFHVYFNELDLVVSTVTLEAKLEKLIEVLDAMLVARDVDRADVTEWSNRP